MKEAQLEEARQQLAAAQEALREEQTQRELQQQRHRLHVAEIERRLDEQPPLHEAREEKGGGKKQGVVMLAAKLPTPRRSTSPFRIPLASPRTAEGGVSPRTFSSPRTSTSLDPEAEWERGRSRLSASPRAIASPASSSLPQHLWASWSSRVTSSPRSLASGGVGSSVKACRPDDNAHLQETLNTDHLDCADPALYAARPCSPPLTFSPPTLYNALAQAPCPSRTSLPAYLERSRPPPDSSAARASWDGSGMWWELDHDGDLQRHEGWDGERKEWKALDRQKAPCSKCQRGLSLFHFSLSTTWGCF